MGIHQQRTVPAIPKGFIPEIMEEEN